jgi:DNA-directed RNA polymerase subunit E'/Rpb7
MTGALLLLLLLFAAAAVPAVRAEGGHVYPNDGAAYFKARFRLVIFRPFVGEVLVGTLTACTK